MCSIIYDTNKESAVCCDSLTKEICAQCTCKCVQGFKKADKEDFYRRTAGQALVDETNKTLNLLARNKFTLKKYPSFLLSKNIPVVLMVTVDEAVSDSSRKPFFMCGRRLVG